MVYNPFDPIATILAGFDLRLRTAEAGTGTPTPTPTPSPAFTTQPSVNPTSGTVGQTFIATDGTVTNGTVTGRRWLLGTTAIGTGTTVTPSAAGSLTLENTALGTNGTTVTSTSSAVAVSAVSPAPAGKVTVMGDSIPAGQYSSPSGPTGYVAVNRLGYGSGVTILNNAVAGESMQTEATRFQNGEYDAGIVVTGASVLVIESGTNDLANFGGNISAAALYTIATNIIAAAIAKGFYVVHCTVLPRTVGGVDSWSSAQETKRLAYNTMVRGNAAGADAIMDQAANVTMGDAANSTTNTALYADGLHPTNAGQDALVPTWKGAIDTQISKTRRFPVLGALSLSSGISNGTASSGTILGAKGGSTITSNVSGLTVNSAARTYAWDGSGAAATIANGLVETLAGSPNSPRSSSVTINAAGATVNYLRLDTKSANIAEAASSPGYTYTATSGTNTGYNAPRASGYSAKTLPAGQDGWIALKLTTALAPSGPLFGFTSTAAPIGFGDVIVGAFADSATGTGYSVLPAAAAGSPLITAAAGDIVRVRRAGTAGIVEVSKDNGATFTTIFTNTITTVALTIWFQTASTAANGAIVNPYASANVA